MLFSSNQFGVQKVSQIDLRLFYAYRTVMAEKRRPSDGPPEMPPSRNLGVGNASCGGRHEAADPLKLIVASGARKEKLRERDFSRPALKLAPRPAPRPYVEMRAASAFSFLDAASLPEDLVEEAARLQIPAVALVERNGVYGAPRFWKAAKAAGIRALVGAEVARIGEQGASGRTGSDGVGTAKRPYAFATRLSSSRTARATRTSAV